MLVKKQYEISHFGTTRHILSTIKALLWKRKIMMYGNNTTT